MDRVLEPEVMDTAEEAAAYDELDHSEVNQAFVDRLVSLGAHGRLLDVGTGPGDIPVLVVERVADCTVLAIDLAPRMLELAEKRRVRSSQAARIALRVADAKALDLDDASFDGVFSNTILHHVADPRLFLCEVRRVLKRGGTLLIRDLYRPPTQARVEELVGMYAGDASPSGREMFRASLCAALTPGELRAIADRCGLEDARLVLDTDRHMSLQLPA
jgi:ubiquinone/menaquinone biosynthesis C-methylase UbiE